MLGYARALVSLLCIISILDISWMGLQVYAWAKMAQDRPANVGWTQAVVDAVSGDAPCEVCLYIQSQHGKAQDNKRATSVDSSPRQPMSLSKGITVRAASLVGAMTHSYRHETGAVRIERPPVPPPELLG